MRDPDITTPGNENKELVDARISEIKNEILSRDLQIPGTRFFTNGGIRGDMAHVYLLRGNPHQKAKIEGNLLSDLMAWIYFDESQRPLYVFLFYNKGGSGFRLFRNYGAIDIGGSIIDALRELARGYPTSNEDFERLYRELVENDSEYIFRFAISQFSSYTDVKLEKVLSPPTPDEMTAKAIQPRILGVPYMPKDMKVVMSPYFSKITGFSQLTSNSNGGYGLTLTISTAGIDWQDTGDRLPGWNRL